MAKINPLIFFCLLLLLHGVLSQILDFPEDEEPIEEEPIDDSLDDMDCEPEPVVPNTVTPPPLDMQDPDPVEEEPPAVTPNTVTPPPLALQDPPTEEDPVDDQTPYTITAEQILQIAPNSESCEAALPEFADECRTASVAAEHISASFEKYDISSRREQAAILAWMVVESGEFRYSRNHFPPPGNPGQGSKFFSIVPSMMVVLFSPLVVLS